MVRRVKWDPESPRFKKACENLEIPLADLELRPKRFFEDEIREEQKSSGGQELTKELGAIRYGYHLQSIKDLLNEIIHERRRIIVKEKATNPTQRSMAVCKSTPYLASPKSEVGKAEIFLTESDLRQISTMKNRNETFAKKLIYDKHRRVEIEQQLILNQQKRA